MAQPRWLTAGEHRAWRAQLAMQSRLSAELNRRLQATCALSLPDYDVLVHLSEAEDGRLRPFALQQRLQWEQSRLAHQLSRMQRRGLVERARSTDDGRGTSVALTDAGRDAIRRAAPAHVEDVRALVFDGLTAADVAAMERLATSVLHRLDDGAPG